MSHCEPPSPTSFDTVAAPIWVLSADGTILTMNAAARSFSPATRPGVALWEVLTPEDGAECDSLRAAVDSVGGRAAEAAEVPLSFGGHAFSVCMRPAEMTGHCVATLIPRSDEQIAARLRDAEHHLAIAIRTSPVTVFSQDAELRYLWIHNPALGYQREEVVGRTDRDLFERAEDAANLERIKRQVLRTGVRHREEVAVFTRGRQLWFDLDVEPVRNASGTTTALIGTASDITAAVASRDEQLRTHNLILTLARSALGGRSAADLRQLACDGIIGILPADCAAVFEVRDATLSIQTSAAIAPEKRAALASIPLQPGVMIAEAFLEAQPKAGAATGSDPDRLPVARLLGMSSGCAVPIGRTGDPQRFGVLVAYSRESREWSPETISFLETVADILGTALAREQAEAAVEREARNHHALSRLGAALLAQRPMPAQDVCATVAAAMQVEYAGLLRADGADLLIDAVAGWPASLTGTRVVPGDCGCLSNTIRTGEITVVDDVLTESRFRLHAIVRNSRARSGVCVPLDTGNGNPGVLVVYAATRRAFTSAEMEYLQSVGHVVSAAMQRNALETVLAKEREELRAIVDTVPDTIARLLPDGTIVWVSEAISNFGKLTPADVSGRRIGDLPGHPDAIRTWLTNLESVVRTARRRSFETISLGGDRTLEVRMIPEGRDGAVDSVLAVTRDVTSQRREEEERLRLRAELEHAKRVASVGQLGTTVAHEFNNVLMSIAPFAEIIRRASAKDASLHRSAEHIRSAIDRGKRVTQDIMRFTRPAEPTLRVVDLAQWLTTTVQQLRPIVGNATLTAAVPSRTVHCSVDAPQLEQIAANLLLNARDATMSTPNPTIQITLAVEDGRAAIFVHDNGAGMPPEVAARAFDPFFTTKRSGTGLGLAVARQIVGAHGGEISVTSAPDEGTTFRLTLPLADDIERDEDTHVPSPTALAGQRCLLVEDEDAVAEGLASLLDLCGVTSKRAADGAAARRENAAEAFDFILLDVGLPDVDGIELFAELRAQRPGIPVVFSTGHGDQARLERFEREHGVAFLVKPYELDGLVRAVVDLATRRGASPRRSASGTPHDPERAA